MDFLMLGVFPLHITSSTVNLKHDYTLLYLQAVLEAMDQKIPYDDYQLPVVFLPSYENPPAWIPTHEVCNIFVGPHFILKPRLI